MVPTSAGEMKTKCTSSPLRLLGGCLDRRVKAEIPRPVVTSLHLRRYILLLLLWWVLGRVFIILILVPLGGGRSSGSRGGGGERGGERGGGKNGYGYVRVLSPERRTGGDVYRGGGGEMSRKRDGGGGRAQIQRLPVVHSVVGVDGRRYVADGVLWR